MDELIRASAAQNRYIVKELTEDELERISADREVFRAERLQHAQELADDAVKVAQEDAAAPERKAKPTIA